VTEFDSKNQNPKIKNPGTMIDSGVDSEASSPESVSVLDPGPPRPDLLLETAETLLALSGKSGNSGFQNNLQRKGKLGINKRIRMIIFSLYLSVSLSICLSLSLSICLSLCVCLSLYMSLSLSVSLILSVSISVCLSISLSLYLSISLSSCLSIFLALSLSL